MLSLSDFSNKYLSQRQLMAVLALVIGLVAGAAAHLLKALIKFIESLVMAGHDVAHAYWVFLVAPVVGILLCALFIRFVVRDDISHGVTKILYAISRQKGQVKGHNCWSSLVASGLTIGFGGSVGAESPIVLTGSALGSTFGRIFKLDHKTMMVLMGCGAAGAIAGIFKAPIAGVMFTLEVLMLDLTMASLIPLLVSCLSATCLTYGLTGSDPLFAFTSMEAFSIGSVPSVIVLGLFCGLLSLYFTRTMNRFEQVFGHFNNWGVRLLFGGALLALLIYLFPPLYGEGYSTITNLLHGDAKALLNNSLFYSHPSWLLGYLALIILVKVFATTATNGGGGCGGTFAPSLFLGCLGGFVFAELWNMYLPGAGTAAQINFALFGMAGVMAGVFHAPLTGVFLIAELTGGYDYFLPLMIVSVMSYLTIRTFEPHNIYAMRLARTGQLLTHHKDQSVLTLLNLDALIDKSIPTLRPDMTLGEVVKVVSQEGGYDFAVVDGGGQLRGLVNLYALRKYIFRSELYRVYTAEQLMQPLDERHRLVATENMETVMNKFQKTKALTLPVITPDGKYVGFVAKARIYGTYRQIMKDFSEE